MTGPDRGELALVLHTHMPYVEGYGTWPFGEEWLWEAIATCYLPLLDALGAHGGGDVTVSVTPVLADQLAAPGVADRFAAFLRDVRRETHRIDVEGCRAAGREEWARELERAADDYERALARVESLDGDLLSAFAPHVAWTSSATHAVLPLLATDAGVRLQLDTGIASHRARFDGAPAADGAAPPGPARASTAPSAPAREWRGGFWLPECAHAPWLDPLLQEAGVHATCVDLTDVLGRGAAAQLAPLRSDDGPLLVPIDRATIELVWSDAGYPAHGLYRDYHAFTVHHHRVWNNAGGTYDPAAARAQARVDAADFVARTIARLDAGAAELGRPALAVCAIDTELLGHWWYEGIDWLVAVLEEAERQGLRIAHLDDALERHEAVPVGTALAAAAPAAAHSAAAHSAAAHSAAAPAAAAPAAAAPAAAAPAAAAPAAAHSAAAPAAAAPAAAAPVTTAPTLPTTTWGTPRDLSTWDGPRVAEIAWRLRALELRTLGGRAGGDVPSDRALRELLALQASDWAFQVTRELSGPYPRERSAGHAAALEAALAGDDGDGRVRALAPFLVR